LVHESEARIRLRIADVTGAVVEEALRLGLDDLEDGIQAAAAVAAGIRVLVTRNVADFGRVRGRNESLQVLPPEVAAAVLRTGT
jgi:hypothetical protein